MSLREHPAVAAALAQFPGAELVDVRQAPPLAAPADVARKPAVLFSLAHLAQLAREEACRIEEAQARLVAAGDRVAPCAEQLAKRDGFDAIARLIDRVRGDQVTLERLKKGVM